MAGAENPRLAPARGGAQKKGGKSHKGIRLCKASLRKIQRIRAQNKQKAGELR